MTKRGVILALGLAIAALAPLSGQSAKVATGVPQSLFLDPVGAFQYPVYVTSPPGDQSRLLVVEHGGLIKLVLNGVVQATPFSSVPLLFRPELSAVVVPEPSSKLMASTNDPAWFPPEVGVAVGAIWVAVKVARPSRTGTRVVRPSGSLGSTSFQVLACLNLSSSVRTSPRSRVRRDLTCCLLTRKPSCTAHAV